VCVLVNQRPRKVGLVLPITHLDERLNVDETQLLADALRLTLGPLLFWNDPNRHNKFISGSVESSDDTVNPQYYSAV
jgi:hypothetical protein